MVRHEETRSGVARVVVPEVLRQLANIHGSSAEVVEEYVANGADAGATRIWVVVAPGQVTVIDNGSGMVPSLLPDDQAYFDMFLEDVAQRRPILNDLRDYVTQVSQKSLQWLMECVALSPKRPVAGTTIRGRRAIGALAFRQIASKAVWRTRPSDELSKEYWPNGNRPANIPTFKLVPPTLERYDMSYQIGISEVPLQDHTGKELASGTRVEISEISFDMENGLRPGLLAEYLRGKFGPDIRLGRLQLVIVDRVSDEGKKTKAGREINVQPVEYKGVSLLHTQLFLKGIPFKVELYYNSTGRVDPPQLRWVGSDRRPLTDLREFQELPWTSGKISGFVEFPSFPETEAPWTTDKLMPLDSPVRNQWSKVVKGVVSQIEEAVTRIEDKTKEKQLQGLATTLASVTTTVMADDEVFRDVIVGGATVKSKNKKEAPAPVSNRVIATVINEHSRGVGGIPLQLMSDRKILAKRETGRSGYISFGVLDDGRYNLEMLIPEGMTPLGMTEYRFNISPNQPGYRVLFHLRTGAPKPEQKKISKLRIWMHGWEQIDEPFSIRRLKDGGYVEINTEAPAMQAAIISRNEDEVAILAAEYVAMAMTLYAVQGNPETMMFQVARLAASIRAAAKSAQKQSRNRKKR